MQQFEDDCVEAFRLIPTFGMVNFAEQQMRAQFPHYMRGRFIGLMPSEDTPIEREANKHMDWPPDEILHIINRTGSATMDDFLRSMKPAMDKHLDRQVFILLVTAFDSLLGRNNFMGTLGQRFKDFKQAKAVPLDDDNNFQEIIQRRNDIAHGGTVTQKYITGSTYSGLLSSSWVRVNGLPANAGVPHTFSIKYLFWAAATMQRLALLC